MDQKILFIDGVASRIGLSISSVRRLLGERRKTGRGDFPLPISAPGCKGRWLASDVEVYLASRSVAPPPVNVPNSPKKQRQEDHARKEAVHTALERHRKSRKDGSNNE
jgi:hypothetical protein